MNEQASETQVASESSAEQGAQVAAETGQPTPLKEKQTVLVCFESGHYKKVTGKWKGDSLWTHWIKENGKMIHINKNKVEYYEEL